MMNNEQLDRIRNAAGFVAALDQSGGSTPAALMAYGVNSAAFSGDDEMFDLIHEMRTRIITSLSFTGDKIIGVILFEDTMDRTVDGRPTAQYLWDEKAIVPILKVDNGLADESHGVQLMKPMPRLDTRLSEAKAKGIFGTKMRAVIHTSDVEGIHRVVAQQFDVANQIITGGLCPIIELEVDIHSPHKSQAEDLLDTAIAEHLDRLDDQQMIMLKLTIPTVINRYSNLIAHPNVVRCFALSGGYRQADAVRLLEKNHGMVASFSRALLEGLTVDQSNADFQVTLRQSIEAIYAASVN